MPSAAGTSRSWWARPSSGRTITRTPASPPPMRSSSSRSPWHRPSSTCAPCARRRSSNHDVASVHLWGGHCRDLRLGAGADLFHRARRIRRRGGVFAWPKTGLPTKLSLSAMQRFLEIEGVWDAALNSVIAAGLCMVLSIALGAPAGYALARYSFRGANLYRLLILMTRAFPLAILALPLT